MKQDQNSGSRNNESLIYFNPDQKRILDWRINSGGIGGVIGPAGCGKTITGSLLAIKLVSEGYARRVLLVAFTNSAANEFSRDLTMILGSDASKFICVRSGYAPGSDYNLPIPFSNDPDVVKKKNIVICTTLSLKHLSKKPSPVSFDNMIIDEAGIERLEHLLSPFVLGINRLRMQITKESNSYEINSVIELASKFGIVATVIGDPKQSRPMRSEDFELSAMEWVLRCTKYDTLYTTYRLPDQLAMLVNEFADYNGLTSAPEIAARRLGVNNSDVHKEFRSVINPDKVVTWVDLNGVEEMAGPQLMV